MFFLWILTSRFPLAGLSHSIPLLEILLGSKKIFNKYFMKGSVSYSDWLFWNFYLAVLSPSCSSINLRGQKKSPQTLKISPIQSIWSDFYLPRVTWECILDFFSSPHHLQDLLNCLGCYKQLLPPSSDLLISLLCWTGLSNPLMPV